MKYTLRETPPLDVVTRWNLTYQMLKIALEYRRVYSQYTHLPSNAKVENGKENCVLCYNHSMMPLKWSLKSNLGGEYIETHTSKFGHLNYGEKDEGKTTPSTRLVIYENMHSRVHPRSLSCNSLSFV
ncbi:hypothetical protein U9M48_014358 [Paspalum notatum var. saurae]|uniref:Uncharacterized protein n=1 Tax=Paspalum notatum var. saurae TaxID=547442 RepID=A0AAQ3WKP7_PASNO